VARLPAAGAGEPAGVAAGVGIVIATRNRRDELLRTLERLAATDPDSPVVVVDNGSQDGAPRAVRAAHPDVPVIELGRNAGAAARTVGARALQAPVVASSDDDSWWAPGALRRVAEVFAAHPSLGLVAARILVGPGRRLDPTCARMEASPLRQAPGLPGARILGFVACGAAVRRSAFLAAGGFHPRMGVGGEETLLALDLAVRGWDLAYLPDVVAHHDPRPDAGRAGRDAVVLRNRLWAAWLRRPAARALSATARALVSTSPGAAADGLRQALLGAGWIAHDRRVVPPALERDLTRLDAA
jgi:GT2 family glycosyltransferase